MQNKDLHAPSVKILPRGHRVKGPFPLHKEVVIYPFFPRLSRGIVERYSAGTKRVKRDDNRLVGVTDGAALCEFGKTY